MPGVGPSPARPGPETRNRFLGKYFLFIIGVAMAPFLESTVATRISRQCGSGPGGQEIQDSTRKPKKTPPGTWKPQAKIQKSGKRGYFLTDLGIDRLHPEPNNISWALGSLKNFKTSKKRQNTLFWK